MDKTQIKAHWDAQAKKFGTHPQATFNDLYLRRLELRNLCRFLEDGCLILDAGCGNGYSTLSFAENFASQFVGMDYSAEMIGRARELQRRRGIDNVKLCVGDFENLQFKSDVFDIVIAARSVTNLPSWKSQKRAIAELTRTLRPGGRLLMSEPSMQGLTELNRARAVFGLRPIPPPWYNLYFEDETLLEETRGGLTLLRIKPYASTYYFGSRVLYPFLLFGRREPRFESLFNRVFSKLPTWGNFGTQRLYVFEKRPGRL